jgi:fructokinase
MFLVCGEALMDVFAAGETATGMTLDARVGGSPFNVAVGLARMGQPVSLLSSISRGFLGDRLMQALTSEGVQTGTVQRSDHPTTLSLVGLDANQIPSYAFYGDGAADRQLTPQALSAIPASVRVLHFASYATVVEPIASTLRALVEQERTRCLVSFDPNVRLNVQPVASVWREHLQWMLPRCHLLKISDEDLGLLLAWNAGIERFAAQALAQGVKLVVVTRERTEGATAWTQTATAHVASLPVSVLDTVGAGDTFQAALLTWLAEKALLGASDLDTLTNSQLESALAFSARAAALTCSRRGADLPRRSEL